LKSYHQLEYLTAHARLIVHFFIQTGKMLYIVRRKYVEKKIIFY
jgi:hypothetical protein